MDPVLDVQPAAPSPAPATIADAPQFDMDAMSYEERQKAFGKGQLPKRLPKPEAKPAAPPAETKPADSSSDAQKSPAGAPGDDDEEALTPAERRKVNRNLRTELIKANERAKVLEEQLAAKQTSAPATPKVEPKPALTVAEKPLPDLQTYLDSGKSTEDWQMDFAEAVTERALTRAEKKVEERFGKFASENNQREFAKTLEGRIKEAKVKYPDFEAKVLKNPNSPPASTAMLHAIRTRPDGMELAHYLAEHPDDAAKIFKASAVDGPKSEARVEFEFDALAERLANPPQKPVETTETKAPPPPRPINGNGTAVADPLEAAMKANPIDWSLVNRIKNERAHARKFGTGK
jgi:hypothetical protein